MKAETEKVISISLKHFNNLKSTLKPKEDEWTSFASIVSKIDEEYKLISFAMGTKSVTGERAKFSNVIIDTHAECLCRRSLKYYLINRMKADLPSKLKDEFYLVISQLPCGIVNRYKGSEKLIRKKPGRGEICSRGTCFDKILKWSLIGLQGRKLSSIYTKPIKFQSIIIGNCSPDVTEQDKDAFRRGFDLRFDAHLEAKLRSFLKIDEQNSRSVGERYERKQDDRRNDSTEDQKLKANQNSSKEEDQNSSKEEDQNSSKEEDQNSSKEEDQNSSKEEDQNSSTKEEEEPRKKKLKVESSNTINSTAYCTYATESSTKCMMDEIKPKILFSESFENEMFTRRDRKRAHDKSIVHFLDSSLNSYHTEVICDGRKHGTTKKNYHRSPLTLSPNSLGELIEQQVKRSGIDLNQNQSIKLYDSLWHKLKSHPNFIRWSTDNQIESNNS